MNILENTKLGSHILRWIRKLNTSVIFCGSIENEDSQESK